MVLSKTPSSTRSMHKPKKLLAAPWHAGTTAQRTLAKSVHFHSASVDWDAYMEIDIVLPSGSFTKMMETG